MDSIWSEPALWFYYGAQLRRLPRLPRGSQVVLQPVHPSRPIFRLRQLGVEPLAYLSLAEDPGPWAAWQRPARNPQWNTALVDPAHPRWVERCLEAVRRGLHQGYAGFFLDNLDSVEFYPEDAEPLLGLVRRIREAAGPARLWVNRGYPLFPELANWVDGVVLESFATTWVTQGYQALEPAQLQQNLLQLRILRGLGLDTHALDYADTPALRRFAQEWATLHRVSTFISVRLLDRV